MDNTSKNFALQLGALITLYVSLTTLLVLLFGIINLQFPDALTNYWQYDSQQSSMRFSIAMLIVFFPTYLYLTRIVNRIRRKEHGVYLTLTKWLIYLSLLVAGLVLLGDLVAVINSFLNGEVTQRFVFKAMSVFIVIGSAFYYYLLDARGYWHKEEQKSIIFGIVVSVIVLVAVVYGFKSIDAPSNVREQRLDQQQVTDLQDMQWRIEDFYRSNNNLPEKLSDIYTGRDVPSAPEDRAGYQYSITGDKNYELCATFAYDIVGRTTAPMPEFDGAKNIMNNNWDYQAGETCFQRVVVETLIN